MSQPRLPTKSRAGRRRGLLLIALSAALVAGCAERKEAARHEVDEPEKSRLCADPAWRADHLGLWYSVCRHDAFSG